MKRVLSVLFAALLGFGAVAGAVAQVTTNPGITGTFNPLTYAGPLGGSSLTATTQFLAPNGSATAPGYAFTSAPNTGVYARSGGGEITITTGGTARAEFHPSLGLYLVDTGSGAFGVGSAIGSAPDVVLRRDAAATPAFRDGTNAQTLRVYKTYTDGSNYLRSNVTGDGITRAAAGTGGAGPAMGACGSSPSLVGNDLAMLVTVGTGGSATSCAVTFGAAFSATPVCVAQNDTDRVAYSMVTTTTTLTITATAAFTASSKFHVLCNGR